MTTVSHFHIAGSSGLQIIKMMRRGCILLAQGRALGNSCRSWGTLRPDNQTQIQRDAKTPPKSTWLTSIKVIWSNESPKQIDFLLETCSVRGQGKLVSSILGDLGGKHGSSYNGQSIRHVTWRLATRVLSAKIGNARSSFAQPSVKDASESQRNQTVFSFDSLTVIF